MKIPTLDASDFLAGSESQRNRFASDLVDSFVRTGFVKIVNHGIPEEMIDDLFKWVSFFAFAFRTYLKAHYAL